MLIDVRDFSPEKVEMIRYADGSDVCCKAQSIYIEDKRVRVGGDISSDVIIAETKEDIRNLIKALEKALECGWGEEE